MLTKCKWQLFKAQNNDNYRAVFDIKKLERVAAQTE